MQSVIFCINLLRKCNRCPYFTLYYWDIYFFCFLVETVSLNCSVIEWDTVIIRRQGFRRRKAWFLWRYYPNFSWRDCIKPQMLRIARNRTNTRTWSLPDTILVCCRCTRLRCFIVRLLMCKYFSALNQGPSVTAFHFHMNISLYYCAVTSQPPFRCSSVCS